MKILREINIDELNRKIRYKGYKRARVWKRNEYKGNKDTVFVMTTEQNGLNNNLDVLSDVLNVKVEEAYWKDDENIYVKIESKFKKTT